MATFRVEVYELHAQEYLVNASCAAEAVAKVQGGEGQMVDGGLNYIETADRYGQRIYEGQGRLYAEQIEEEHDAALPG